MPFSLLFKYSLTQCIADLCDEKFFRCYYCLPIFRLRTCKIDMMTVLELLFLVDLNLLDSFGAILNFKSNFAKFLLNMITEIVVFYFLFYKKILILILNTSFLHCPKIENMACHLLLYNIHLYFVCTMIITYRQRKLNQLWSHFSVVLIRLSYILLK